MKEKRQKGNTLLGVTVAVVIVSAAILLLVWLVGLVGLETKARKEAKENTAIESSAAESNAEVSEVRKYFPTEKILTISAKEYCESIGKQLTDYKLVGVHAKDFNYSNVPPGTEIVVGYGLGYAGTQYRIYVWQYGTALIPREKATGN